MALNSMNAIGRLTKDPELKKTTTGKDAVEFILAVPRDNSTKELDFLKCICYGKTASNLVKYTKKGYLICISQARFRTSNYKTKDGNFKNKYEFTVGKIQYLKATGQDVEESFDDNYSSDVDISNIDISEENLPF